MNFTCIGFGAVIIFAGVLFAFRKLLPRSWKQMTEEERSKVKIKSLCINVGVMIMLCGAILLTKGFWADFAGKWFLIAMIVWLALCIADLIYISKSKRYRGTR